MRALFVFMLLFVLSLSAAASSSSFLSSPSAPSRDRVQKRMDRRPGPFVQWPGLTQDEPEEKVRVVEKEANRDSDSHDRSREASAESPLARARARLLCISRYSTEEEIRKHCELPSETLTNDDRRRIVEESSETIRDLKAAPVL